MRGISYFKKIMENIDYSPVDNFSKIASENFLKGFFNCAEILLSSKEIDYLALKETYIELLKKLEQEDWLSSTSLVSYILFGLKDLRIGKNLQKKAADFLEKEITFYKGRLSDLTPDVCLAMPNLLSNFIKEPYDFFEKVRSLSDVKVAHVLIALELLSKVDRSITSNLRSHILERFRKRQITEVDKKITKQLLDLTLLLRSGLRGPSLKNRIDKFTSLIVIELESSGDILFRVKLDRLFKDFGDLNITALSSYVVALSLTGEEYVHLLSPSQYNLIKNFFVENTIPIPRKRELGFEVTALGVFVTFFSLTLLGLTYLMIHLVQQFEQLSLLKGNEWSVAALISTSIFGLLFWKIGKIFKVLKGIVKRT